MNRKEIYEIVKALKFGYSVQTGHCSGITEDMVAAAQPLLRVMEQPELMTMPDLAEVAWEKGNEDPFSAYYPTFSDFVVGMGRSLMREIGVDFAIAWVSFWCSGTIMEGNFNLPSTRCCMENIHYAQRVLRGRTRMVTTICDGGDYFTVTAQARR
jgi:hypothetical protein